MAVRFQAPIFTYENILDKAGIYLKIDEDISEADEEEEEEEEKKVEEFEFALDNDDNIFVEMSLSELQDQLNDAVINEDYELAARIRDEISKRS